MYEWRIYPPPPRPSQKQNPMEHKSRNHWNYKLKDVFWNHKYEQPKVWQQIYSWKHVLVYKFNGFLFFVFWASGQPGKVRALRSPWSFGKIQRYSIGLTRMWPYRKDFVLDSMMSLRIWCFPQRFGEVEWYLGIWRWFWIICLRVTRIRN